MAQQIEDEIRENRRQTSRAFAADRIADPNTSQSLATAPTPVEVDVTVEIYTRPLNDTLIVGHPDASQGWGRGVVGDYRGGWTKQATETTTLTRAGRAAIAEAVVGQDTTIGTASVGTADVNASGIDDAPDTTRARGSFRFDESPDPVSSATLDDSEGRIVASTSLSNVAAGVQREVRADVTLVFSPLTGTDAAVTDIATVADAIRSASDDRLTEIAIGTDDTQPAQSDAALGNEVFRRAAVQTASGSTASLRTVADRPEPSTQPHDIVELGLINQAGDLVTRRTFGAELKDDRVRLALRGGVDIR